jgi:integrase
MAKGDFKGHLWKRGYQWYFRFPVPKPLRRYFLSSTGKPMGRIVEPLGDSREVAKLKALQRVATCHAVFAQIRAGVIKTPEQAKASLRGPDERQEINEAVRRWAVEQRAAWFEAYGRAFAPQPGQPESTAGETISQAAEAWLAELSRDKTVAPRAETLKGHRDRVRAFTRKCGDVPLTDVTRAMASDFLSGLDVSNRTRNNYAMTLKCVFDSARKRGRFTGDNPFADQRAKVVKNHYEAFTIEELQKLFGNLPREIKPVKHSPETALPWAALIALYSGACLEEICQLTVDDIYDADANGGTMTVFDIHNGDDGHKLKNEKARPRLLPIHSQLVRLGLQKYIANLPKHGQLFPGLTRRASKGGKVGARLGEIFRKKLVALALKRDGLCFHSFRHTVAGRLDAAGVPQSDAARVLGHAVAGMSYGTYSQAGPGLKRVAAVVEQITYEGLRP